MSHSSVAEANYAHDGDGQRVKSIINGETTLFVGAHYEVNGSTVTKYYFAGAQRIAMRKDGMLNYILSDHLGSTAMVTDSSGNLVSELRYKAWGEVRYNSGVTPTDYTYTGQYSNMDDFKLMYYNARWYDPYLARFAQADTIVPGGVQGYDRYAYVNNNPVRHNDPTGHWVVETNEPREELRRNSYIRAAERVEEKDPLSTHLKEYYITAASYYQAVVSGLPEEVITGIGAALENKAGNVRRNGWNGNDAAQSAAFDGSGVEAMGIAGFGVNITGAIGGGRIPLANGVTELPDGMEWVDIYSVASEEKLIGHGVNVVKVNKYQGEFISGFDVYDPEPIRLRMTDDGWIFIRDGNHRVQAALNAGYAEIPAIVTHYGSLMEP